MSANNDYKTWVAGNPFPSFEEMSNFFDTHLAKSNAGAYFFINSEYGYIQHNSAKIVYNNLFTNDEEVRKAGLTIFKTNGIEGMRAVFYAILHWIAYKSKKQDFVYTFKQLERVWAGVGDWKW
jgi:hypothetical protein